MREASVLRSLSTGRGGRWRALLVLVGGVIVWLLARRGRRALAAGRLQPPSPPRPIASGTRLQATAPVEHLDAGPAVRGVRPARRRRRPVGLLIGAAGVVVALVAAGGVLAYTTGSGVGFGAAEVDNSQPLTIAPGTAVDPLFPGSSADVVATISNPNAIPIHAPALGLDTTQGTAAGFSVDAAHAACNLDSLHFNGLQTDGGAPFVVPPKGSLDVDLGDAVSMDTTATGACQGATLTVYLKVVP